MVTTLRHLLIQRAARLQERPAFSAPGWGTLSYAHLRQRVEGVALGIMADPPPQAALFARTGSPWDWAAEIAAACCGFRWESGAPHLGPEVLGGLRFNAEDGRQPYHDQEDQVQEATPFLPNRTQGELLQRLRRLGVQLGWDHETHLRMPLAWLGTGEGRAALWSALYAGAHAELHDNPDDLDWNPAAFEDLLSDGAPRLDGKPNR